MNKKQLLALKPGEKFGITIKSFGTTDHVHAIKRRSNKYFVFWDIPAEGEDGKRCEQLIEYIDDDGSWTPMYGEGTAQAYRK